MRLWLIQQSENDDYDTYDSAIVAANTEDEAKRIHPGGWDWNDSVDTYYTSGQGTWCKSPDAVTATCIGTAGAMIEPGVILSSFNAG